MTTPPPPFKPRQYLPATIDLGDVNLLKAFYGDLSERLSAVTDAEGLVKWLELYDELHDAISEEAAKRYIDTNGDLRDEALAKAYEHFTDVVDPELATPNFELMRQLRAHPAFGQLPPYYDVFRRNLSNAVDLFHPDNDEKLTPQEGRLGTEYAKVSGAMSIELDGQSFTPDQLKPVMEGTDRAKRREAWEKLQQVRLAEHEHFHQLLDRQIEVREQMALNAGFETYLEYIYRQKGRFEYTKEDTLQMHQAIADHFTPFLRAFQEERRQALIASGQLAPGETLKPWDLDVDPQGRPPLKPFQSGAEFNAKMTHLFNAIYPELGDPVAAAARDGLVDAENRPGKAPGYGECMSLPESRRAYFSSNGVGVAEDIDTALHEFGHLVHAIFAFDHSLGFYRGEPPLEFCETAAVTMELVGSNHMDEVYPDRADQLRGQRHTIEGFFKYILWVASTDALQHWIYAHPGHTHEERDAEWLRQKERFGGIEDWSGHEDAKANQWQERPHFWRYPLYAPEYLQAAGNALEKSAQYDRDPVAAMKRLIEGFKLGVSQPLPVLVETAGLTFDPRGEKIGASMAILQKKFDALRAEEKALAATPARRTDFDQVQLKRTIPPEPAVIPDREQSLS